MHAFLRFLVCVYYEILTVHLSDCVHGYHNVTVISLEEKFVDALLANVIPVVEDIVLCIYL